MNVYLDLRTELSHIERQINLEDSKDILKRMTKNCRMVTNRPLMRELTQPLEDQQVLDCLFHPQETYFTVNEFRTLTESTGFKIDRCFHTLYINNNNRKVRSFC